MPSIRVVSTAQSCKSSKILMQQNRMWWWYKHSYSLIIHILYCLSQPIITCESLCMFPCASVAKQTCAYTHLCLALIKLWVFWDLGPTDATMLLSKQTISKHMQHLTHRTYAMVNSMIVKPAQLPWKPFSFHSHSPYVDPSSGHKIRPMGAAVEILRRRRPTAGATNCGTSSSATSSCSASASPCATQEPIGLA